VRKRYSNVGGALKNKAWETRREGDKPANYRKTPDFDVATRKTGAASSVWGGRNLKQIREREKRGSRVGLSGKAEAGPLAAEKRTPSRVPRGPGSTGKLPLTVSNRYGESIRQKQVQGTPLRIVWERGNQAKKKKKGSP